MKLSRGWKFFISFGGGFLILLLFLMMGSNASLAIGAAAPVASIIVFYLWTKNDPEPPRRS